MGEGREGGREERERREGKELEWREEGTSEGRKVCEGRAVGKLGNVREEEKRGKGRNQGEERSWRGERKEGREKDG